MIVRLEQQGWLARAGDPSDGRGVRVSLTAKGRDVLRAAVPVHARTIREELLDRLTPAEQEVLTEVLSRIVEDRASIS
jgi:DNA-binding MarR family transcriptional regulator